MAENGTLMEAEKEEEKPREDGGEKSCVHKRAVVALGTEREMVVWDRGHQTPVAQPSKLKEIYCCRCNKERKVEYAKLFTKTAFSTIKCGGSKCGRTAVSDRWNCRCMIQWIKCPRHIHIASQPKKRQSKEVSEKKRQLAKYGTDKPRPRLRPRVMAKCKKPGVFRPRVKDPAAPHGMPIRSMPWARIPNAALVKNCGDVPTNKK